jgi:hypothetical protein
MSTGNDPYAEHVRGQLAAVLDDVTPPAAPTAAVKRRGKAIRVRRRAGVGAGLAVAVVAAALLPGLLHQSKAQVPITPTHKNPKVTVGNVGRDAPHGLIAKGAINGKPWRITLSWQGKYLCARTSGNSLSGNDCGPSDSYAATDPVTLIGTGNGRISALYGTVTGQVRRVSIVLSDGVALDLRPVRFSGDRWVGLELPVKLAVTQVVAYSRSGELAHAIPFTAVRGGLPSIEAWLRPEQPAPREFARLIGSGVSAGKRWSVTLRVGPWGQCVVAAIPGNSGNVDCFAGSTQQTGVMGSGDPVRGPWWFLGDARPKVSYLVLSMTDGSTLHVPTVQVGGVRLYAIVIIHRPRIVHWAAYDASGHRLYGGQGAPSFGHR